MSNPATRPRYDQNPYPAISASGVEMDERSCDCDGYPNAIAPIDGHRGTGDSVVIDEGASAYRDISTPRIFQDVSPRLAENINRLTEGMTCSLTPSNAPPRD
jgi:hypothetical protein